MEEVKNELAEFPPGRGLDLIGQTSGRLQAIRRIENHKHGYAQWLCKCTCGNDTIVIAADFKSGRKSSCGCLRIKHGHAIRGVKSPEYQSWYNMRQRCMYTSDKNYHRYGGRGVLVCAQWAHSFENFFADMGPKPPATTLGRYLDMGNYEPGNVKWMTRIEQENETHNKRVMGEYLLQELLYD